MDCPDCHNPDDIKVTDTRHIEGNVIMRRRRCSCGARWVTHEKKISDTFIGVNNETNARRELIKGLTPLGLKRLIVEAAELLLKFKSIEQEENAPSL